MQRKIVIGFNISAGVNSPVPGFVSHDIRGESLLNSEVDVIEWAKLGSILR
jgi:hypothetical protein